MNPDDGADCAGGAIRGADGIELPIEGAIGAMRGADCTEGAEGAMPGAPCGGGAVRGAV